MSITILSVPDRQGANVFAHDVMGFPTVTWTENRPNSVKQVECKIEFGNNNELLFQTNGSILEAPMYWRRPWEKLVAFRSVPASQLYYTGLENRLRQEFMNMSALFRLWLPNDAVVMTAEFADDHPSVPMHLNYGIGTPMEVIELHNALHRLFIGEREAIVNTICHGEYQIAGRD